MPNFDEVEPMPGYTREAWKRILDKLEKVHGADLRHQDRHEDPDEDLESEWWEGRLFTKPNPSLNSAIPFELTDREFLKGCGIADDVGDPKNAAAAPRET